MYSAGSGRSKSETVTDPKAFGRINWRSSAEATAPHKRLQSSNANVLELSTGNAGLRFAGLVTGLADAIPIVLQILLMRCRIFLFFGEAPNQAR